jgi:hypothetical protein
MASIVYLVMFVGLPLLMTVVQIVTTRSARAAEADEDAIPKYSMRDFKRRDD